VVYRVFDLLAIGKHEAVGDPFERRRDALEQLVGSAGDPGSVEVTPLVRDIGDAEPWLRSGEGVIAKQVDAPYRPGERKGMVKVSCDPVAAGRIRHGSKILRWRDDKDPADCRFDQLDA